MPGETLREEIRARTISWDSLPERADLRSDEIFIHRLTRLPGIKKAYEAQGWNATVIPESIFGLFYHESALTVHIS